MLQNDKGQNKIQSITESTWLYVEKKSVPNITLTDNSNFRKTHIIHKQTYKPTNQTSNNKVPTKPPTTATEKINKQMNKQRQQQQQQQLQRQERI